MRTVARMAAAPMAVGDSGRNGGDSGRGGSRGDSCRGRSLGDSGRGGSVGDSDWGGGGGDGDQDECDGDWGGGDGKSSRNGLVGRTKLNKLLTSYSCSCDGLARSTDKRSCLTSTEGVRTGLMGAVMIGVGTTRAGRAGMGMTEVGSMGAGMLSVVDSSSPSFIVHSTRFACSIWPGMVVSVSANEKTACYLLNMFCPKCTNKSCNTRKPLWSNSANVCGFRPFIFPECTLRRWMSA